MTHVRFKAIEAGNTIMIRFAKNTFQATDVICLLFVLFLQSFFEKLI